VGIASLCALVGIVLHFGEAKRFVELARDAQPSWLALALVLQALTYAAEAGSWQGVLHRAGVPRPEHELYALSLVALFTNQVVPTAGVAGTVLVVRALVQRGVPQAVAVAAMLVDLVGYYAAFGVAIGFAFAVIGKHHDLSPAVLVMAGGIAVLGIAISGTALWITAPSREVPKWLQRWGIVRRALMAIGSADPELLRAPPLLARAWVLRLGNFACDALTLWACLRAIGMNVPPAAASAAFVIGAIARTLGIVPGGLGTFEGGVIGGLALFGVGIEPGLTAALLFRGFSFWLPMLPGLVLGHRIARE
jgi:uncharacterized membrane protein YbhN (UPF0104 family)